MKQRLEKLGQNVESLTRANGDLTHAMTDATARLDQLRKQKAAAEARVQTFRNRIARLRSMIDAGQLEVAIRGGRMLIDSGQTAVKSEGKAALAKVARAEHSWRRGLSRRGSPTTCRSRPPGSVELGAVEPARRRGRAHPVAHA